MRAPTLLTLTAVALAVLAGCGRTSETLAPGHDHAAFNRTSGDDDGRADRDDQDSDDDDDRQDEHRRWVAQLRRAMAPYNRFDAATAAGYTAQITPCMEQDGVGGMGFHYGNPSLIDAEVDPLRPELLLYEPQRNGRMRFVAVEFIVPYTAWTAAEPPTVNGIPMHRNDVFQVWIHHVWIMKDNPSGVFADWNPRVSCRFAK